MSISLSQKIIRNTIFGSIGRFWTVLISLLLTPYIISKLGIERFGIWAIISILIGYFGLIDFGVGASYVKHIAEYYAKKDYKSINEIVNTGFTFYLILGFAIILPILFTHAVLDLFKMSPEIYKEVSFVFIGALIIFAFSNVFSVFGAVIDGLQRMDISNTISIVSSIPMAIGVIVFLRMGYGLKGLLINNAIIIALVTSVTIVYAHKVLPQLKFNPLLFSSKILRKLFSYGIKIQVSRLSGLVNFQIDKILLGYLLSVGMVTFYELGSRVTMFMRSLPAMLLPAIIPAASELNVLKDRDLLQKLYMRGSKYLAGVTIPLAFFVLITAPLIMLAWMGKTGFELSVLAIQLLTLGYSINLLTGIATSVARGMGIVQYEMRSSILVPIMNVILSVVLIIKIGFVGALIATSFSVIVGSIYFMIMFQKHIKQSFFQLIRKIYLIPIFACILASLAIYTLGHVIYSFTFPSGRIAYLLVLGLEGLIFLGVYGLVLFKSGYIDEYDRGLALRYIDIVKKRLVGRKVIRG